MTQDEIIRMAREAGPDWWLNTTMLERFAALVAAHEREKHPDMFNKGYQSAKEMYQTELNLAVTAAVLAEREACAKLADGFDNTDGFRVAAAIRERSANERARGETK